VQVDDPSKYGVVVIDEYGQVQRFVEKPKVRSAHEPVPVLPTALHAADLESLHVHAPSIGAHMQVAAQQHALCAKAKHLWRIWQCSLSWHWLHASAWATYCRVQQQTQSTTAG
jgi:hypothetical protein